ncbi:unnamed protein product, partial [Aduncisulcus paluster]
MQSVFGDLMEEKRCVIYMDDILVVGSSEEEFLYNLEIILDRCAKKGLSINFEKCFLGFEEVEFLGYTISGAGKQIAPGRISSIENLRTPSSKRDVKCLLGMVNFVRSFIPACSSVCEPLSRLTAKDSDFVWGKEQDEAFERLKRLLKTAPTLAFPSEDAHLSLFTDASDVGVGAVLSQTKDSKIQVLAFLSKTLSDVQRRWSVIEKECWAIVFAMLKLEPLLKGRKFDLFTDHKNLTFIQRSPNAKISRWWLRVSEFSFDIRHVKGV